MSIQVHIHKTHRQFTDGKAVLETSGTRVDACLQNLISKYPDMEQALFEKKGKLKNTIEVYVNQESAYPNELEKQVKDGDVIHLIVMIAGG